MKWIQVSKEDIQDKIGLRFSFFSTKKKNMFHRMVVSNEKYIFIYDTNKIIHNMRDMLITEIDRLYTSDSELYKFSCKLKDVL